ncbi:MAG: TspO/MBR family protein [Maricaulaceae bacterium]
MSDLVLAFLGFLAANFAAASSGGVFKPGAWYENLAKPGWTPPNWAFPITWSVLFLMNTVSGWMVWRATDGEPGLALGLYALSLGMNFAWSALFFGLKRMDWALVDVVLLWLSIAAVAAVFAPISVWAAALQLPYLIWVTIAGVLNVRLLQMNPNATPAGAAAFAQSGGR